MLPIDEAFELYEKIHPFLPPTRSGNVIDFTGKIIKNIKNSDTPEVFSDLLLLMYEYDLETLAEFSGMKLVEIFIDGLIENQIITLVDFCEQLGL